MALTSRLTTLGAALLSLCLLQGCESPTVSERKAELRGTINVLVSLDGVEDFSEGKLEEQAALTQEVIDNYHYLHPGVNIQIELSTESNLLKIIRDRQNDGLSPDLILTSGLSARKLHDEKFSLPVSTSRNHELEINPGLLQRLRVENNQLAGVPVFLIPQIACYNRQRLPQNPTSLNRLLEISDRGIEIGMALDMVDLFWTVGAWGGQPALDAAPSRKALTPLEKKGILRWLESLLDASKHLKINFYDNQEELTQGLLNGRLDWITCRSSSFARLRKKLGVRLGVGTLPSGPAGPPSPLIISKVWVFGRDSSPYQRRIAEGFVHFSTNSIMQRYIALTTQQMLPANQIVPVPTGDSAILKAMVIAEKQSQTNGAARSLRTNYQNLERVTQLVTEMIYGERSPEQTSVDILSVIQ